MAPRPSYRGNLDASLLTLPMHAQSRMFQSPADLIRRLQTRRRSEVYGLILPLKGEVSDRRLVLDERNPPSVSGQIPAGWRASEGRQNVRRVFSSS